MSARFDIRDRSGCIATETMRALFEQCIRDTPSFRQTMPLDHLPGDGTFGYYVDPQTDSMWLGFAIGMRCAERITKAIGSAS
jgi:hypothetical protein